jgi:PAS domain S-box-containing protein
MSRVETAPVCAQTSALHGQTKSVPYPLHSEGVFRRLVESTQDYAIFLLTPEGNVASWNPGAERLKQYQAHEIMGKHFSIFYPQEEVAKDKPGMELRVASEVGRFEDEGWRIRKDGSRFWANVVITAVRDDDGSLIGFGKIARDVTDRRETELRYRLLIEGVTDYAIYSLDPKGNITSWNSGAQRIKGYTSEEIIGKHFSQFYTKEDADAGLPRRVLEAAAARGHYEAEGWRVRKDGSKFWSSVVVTPIRSDEGELVGFSKITRDISDRRELLEKIQQHAQELEIRIAEREQTNAELEAFSYSVSHDLRAPLRAIEGFVDIVLTDFRDKLPAPAIEHLQHVIRAAARMNHLVQDLLNYSRLSRMEIQPARVKLATAVEDARQQINEKLRDNVSVSVDPLLSVFAHLPTLTQILLNLISNGLKFYPAGETPRVAVSAQREGQNVVVSVRDEGIGIARQHQARIFQVFERLHTADVYPGTGIGLAIVKRGVTRMGGTVRLESAPGKGSTFYISLPVA